MDTAPTPRRQLRRIRTLLALLAGATAILIAAACRLESTARAFAALATVGCLVAWAAMLEVEGRIAERVEHLPGARRGGAVTGAPARRRRRQRAGRRNAA
ncbi:hypothetical protein [Lysobacter humi (ex Lee et al. 2017)]